MCCDQWEEEPFMPVVNACVRKQAFKMIGGGIKLALEQKRHY